MSDFLPAEHVPACNDQCAGNVHYLEGETRVYVGHIPADYLPWGDDWMFSDGLDVLLTVFADGSREVATRPGRGNRSLRWSPPVQLVEESS